MCRTPAYSSSPTSAIIADWDQPTGDARSVRTRKQTEKVRQGTQVNRNTEDRTLYTYRTVPTGNVRRVPYNLPGISEPKQYCGRRHFSSTVLWAPSTPILDKYGKAPPRTSEASTVLWAPAFTIPGEYGKTPYMPLGINSVADTNIFHT